jgi:pimeloyl-ACP methyl ester carboxylesterase
VNEGTLERPNGTTDGRMVGYADDGPDSGATPVMWCHGGPGSRLEPATMAPHARDAGLRMIGIDRPGYGRSTPQPGRDIAGWVDDGLAVMDALGIERFVTVGVSTGGAYALATAARAPERVIGVVACCALSDMRWREGKAAMTDPETGGIWSAPDRDAAIAIVRAGFGDDGSGMLQRAAEPDRPLAPADLEMFADPEFIAGLGAGMSEMFAFGVQGYVDDRLADGPGWGSFDVEAITCPVRVIHGGSDFIVPVAHAHHTAEIVPGATLEVFEDLGHFSISRQIVPAVDTLTRG